MGVNIVFSLIFRRISTLAGRAEKRRPARLNQPPHAGPAAPASLALAAVNVKAMLEIA